MTEDKRHKMRCALREEARAWGWALLLCLAAGLVLAALTN